MKNIKNILLVLFLSMSTDIILPITNNDKSIELYVPFNEFPYNECCELYLLYTNFIFHNNNFDITYALFCNTYKTKNDIVKIDKYIMLLEKSNKKIYHWLELDVEKSIREIKKLALKCKSKRIQKKLRNQQLPLPTQQKIDEHIRNLRNFPKRLKNTLEINTQFIKIFEKIKNNLASKDNLLTQ